MVFHESLNPERKFSLVAPLVFIAILGGTTAVLEVAVSLSPNVSYATNPQAQLAQTDASTKEPSFKCGDGEGEANNECPNTAAELYKCQYPGAKQDDPFKGAQCQAGRTCDTIVAGVTISGTCIAPRCCRANPDELKGTVPGGQNRDQLQGELNDLRNDLDASGKEAARLEQELIESRTAYYTCQTNGGSCATELKAFQTSDNALNTGVSNYNNVAAQIDDVEAKIKAFGSEGAFDYSQTPINPTDSPLTVPSAGDAVAYDPSKDYGFGYTPTYDSSKDYGFGYTPPTSPTTFGDTPKQELQGFDTAGFETQPPFPIAKWDPAAGGPVPYLNSQSTDFSGGKWSWADSVSGGGERFTREAGLNASGYVNDTLPERVGVVSNQDVSGSAFPTYQTSEGFISRGDYYSGQTGSGFADGSASVSAESTNVGPVFNLLGDGPDGEGGSLIGGTYGGVGPAGDVNYQTRYSDFASIQEAKDIGAASGLGTVTAEAPGQAIIENPDNPKPGQQVSVYTETPNGLVISNYSKEDAASLGTDGLLQDAAARASAPDATLTTPASVVQAETARLDNLPLANGGWADIGNDYNDDGVTGHPANELATKRDSVYTEWKRLDNLASSGTELTPEQAQRQADLRREYVDLSRQIRAYDQQTLPVPPTLPPAGGTNVGFEGEPGQYPLESAAANTIQSSTELPTGSRVGELGVGRFYTSDGLLVNNDGKNITISDRNGNEWVYGVNDNKSFTAGELAKDFQSDPTGKNVGGGPATPGTPDPSKQVPTGGLTPAERAALERAGQQPPGGGERPPGSGSPSGGGSGGLEQLLKAIAPALMQALAPKPPQAPAQACATDPNAMAQQQQQFQYQMQMYQYQLQQQQYQKQMQELFGGGNPYGMGYGYQPQPIMPTPCTPQTPGAGQCPALPAPPPPTACPDGSWQQVPTPWINGIMCPAWKCVPSNILPPTATLSCEPKVADVGQTLAITYGCSSGTASSSSFTVTTQPGGSATTTVAAPPQGTNTATYTLSCTDQGKTSGAQCSVQVSRPNIILVANPKTVAPEGISLLSWLTSGMKSCVISSPDQPDFTQRNAANTSVTGVATSSPISSQVRFQLDCKTLADGDRQATTTVNVTP